MTMVVDSILKHKYITSTVPTMYFVKTDFLLENVNIRAILCILDNSLT